MLSVPLDKLYWINAAEGKIQRANLDGSAIEDLVSGLGIVHGLAIDPDGERIYWIDLSRKVIQRANHDGSNVEDVVSGLESPAALALGPLKIYWVDRKLKQILCANLNGARTAVVVAGLQHPNALVLDSLAGKLYWGDYGTKMIHRADLDGTNVENVVPYGKSSNGIALDALHSKLFWANFGTKAIFRANLNGSDMEPIVRDLLNPSAITLGPKGQKIYWVDRDAQKIQSAGFDGTGVADVLTGLKDPWGIVLGPESGTVPAGPEAKEVERPAELHLRILRQEAGAAPVTMLCDPESTGTSLLQRVQDVAKKPNLEKEQSALFFFTNTGGARTQITEPWKTLKEQGIQDGATIEAELVGLGGALSRAPQGQDAAATSSNVKEITKYSWGDEGSTIKIYVMEASNAEAIAAAKDGKGEQVKADFKPKSFVLTITDGDKSYALTLRGLFKEIVPEKCRIRVSEGKKITITLTKKLEHEAWKSLSEKTW